MGSAKKVSTAATFLLTLISVIAAVTMAPVSAAYAVLDGVDRKTAAENCGMDRQTLRDWAHRYNAEGVSGLFNRRPPDPPCLLSAAQKEELAEMVRAGPDPETDGVVRWRRIDLKRKIEERFGVTMLRFI